MPDKEDLAWSTAPHPWHAPSAKSAIRRLHVIVVSTTSSQQSNPAQCLQSLHMSNLTTPKARKEALYYGLSWLIYVSYWK